MKTLKQFLMITSIVMLIGITGCSQPGTTTFVKEINLSQDETKTLVNEIKNMGFDTNGYIIENGRIIVEGDISFDTKELKKQISSENKNSSGPMKQYAHICTVSPQGVSNIRIYATYNDIPGTNYLGVRSDWMAALDRAIADWNNSGTAVHFTRVGAGGVDIFIAGCNAGTSFVCQSSFPTSNNDSPGNQILINYYTDNLNPALTDSNKENTMVHELGHTIGLRHINVNESNRILIPGTPIYDYSSVMITDCYKSWTGFSAGDQQAIWYLFDNTTPYVILYEHSGYTGKRFLVRGNNDYLGNNGFNDITSSIKLFNRAKVILFKDSGYTGSYIYVTSSSDYLSTFNDVASSISFYTF